MKAILISIQPQWVEKILKGEKTIEIRKTIPKCELPCKVYIYCTKGQELWGDGTGETWHGIDENEDMQLVHELNPTLAKLNGKIVAEFALKNVVKFDIESIIFMGKDKELMQKSCIGGVSLRKYIGNKIGYACGIDDLKIYDTPKELSEFYIETIDDDCCVGCPYHETPIGEEPCKNCYGNRKYITRPPQSWCYVEGLEDE